MSQKCCEVNTVNEKEKALPGDDVIQQWLLCCGDQIKHFPPTKMKFHLIDKVMMWAMGQARSGDNDGSHLTYLLDYHLQFYGRFRVTLSSLLWWRFHNQMCIRRPFIMPCLLSQRGPVYCCGEMSFITSQFRRFTSMSDFQREDWGRRWLPDHPYRASVFTRLQVSDSAWGMMPCKMNAPLRRPLLLLILFLRPLCLEWMCMIAACGWTILSMLCNIYIHVAWPAGV